MRQKSESALTYAPLFRDAGFEPEDFSVKRFKRGEELCDIHDGVLSACLIVSGRADVFSISPDGGETVLSTLFPGDCFGISNLFGQELVTRVVCAVGCEVAFIPKSVIREKLAKNSLFCERYMRLLNSKLTFLTTRIAVLTAKSGRAKLAHYLLSRCNEENTVHLTCSKEQLAKSLDMSHAALFREFSQFVKENIIECDKNIVKIIKPDILSGFISHKKERGNIK